MKLNPKIHPVLALAIVLVAILLIGCCSVDKAMFPAPGAGYSDSPEIIKLDSDGTQISAVYLKSLLRPAKGAILYSHGNAEDIGQLHDVFRLYAANGYDIFAYDYRGYGLSQGRTTQAGCFNDIEAAYNYMKGPLGIAPERIIVFGRSIGSGPSVWLASERKIGALVVESGFTSTFAVVLHSDSLPFDKFQNIERIKKVKSPVLVIHGRRDNIISFSHGEALFAAANEPKSCHWVDGAGHNDLLLSAGPEYWKALDALALRMDAASLDPLER